MMKLFNAALIAGALSLAAASTSQAVLLTYWNFNDSTAGTSGNPGVVNFASDGGVFGAGGALTITQNFAGTNGGAGGNRYGTFAGTTVNGDLGEVAGLALAIQGFQNNGKSFVFSTPTTGYEDVVVSFATQRTATGFTTNTFEYSVDGTNFTAFGSTFNPATSFATVSFDLSSIAAVENVPNVYFRVTVAGINSVTNNTGNNRYDNIRVDATVIPEPAALGLLAPAAMLLGRRRK